MSKEDTRTRPKLPVTSEVGSEGGSFADNTVQVPTFEEELGRVSEDVEPEKVESGAPDVIRQPNETP